MDTKFHRILLFNSSNIRNENNSCGKTNFKNPANIYLNLPFLSNNSFENGNSEKDVEYLKKQVYKNKVTINEKKKELQVLKIQYNKLLKENRADKKMIFEVLDLRDEGKGSTERKDSKENLLESSYISQEQLLNKINTCKIDDRQKEKLQMSYAMLNLKEELNSKRKLLLTKRREYNELKQGISLKNMNEMNNKLETIRVNERKLQNEVTTIEDRLSKNDELIKQLEIELKSEEKTFEEMSKQEAEYELKYKNKLNEMKQIENDISIINIRRKNKITKLTNNKYEGIKMKGCRLKSKIKKIKNDINKIKKYEEEERNKLVTSLEGKRNTVNELKDKCRDLEKEINVLELKNTKLYVKVTQNNQERIALENRGKEQNKDIKRIQELEKAIHELKGYKDKLIIELENRQKNTGKKKHETNKIENNTEHKKDDTNKNENNVPDKKDETNKIEKNISDKKDDTNKIEKIADKKDDSNKIENNNENKKDDTNKAENNIKDKNEEKENKEINENEKLKSKNDNHNEDLKILEKKDKDDEKIVIKN